MALNSVTLTQEQFQELLSRINNVPVQEGNFTKCSSRFNGSKDSDVKAFIDAVQTYKDCSKVSDANALRGLPMLLDGFAATWWQGVKNSTASWTDAIDLLQTTYGPKKPNYKVFRELFSKEQDSKTNCDIFICNVRAILSQLPPDTLSESLQLDMVYGLLHKRIREKVTRDEITTFTDLLKKCRLAEETFTDHFDDKPADASKRIKCNFCKFFGHTKEECRKLNYKKENPQQASTIGKTDPKPVTAVTATTAQTALSTSSSTIRCFGCSKPGYVRSNCPDCRTPTSSASSSIDFCSLESTTKTISPKARPVLPIQILTSNGTGMIDTAARQSVASASLCKVLENAGHEFSYDQLRIRLADGTVKDSNVRITTVDVNLQGRSIPTTFICLPTAEITLLGIEFLSTADISIDVGKQLWYFNNSPDEKFILNFENIDTSSSLEIHSISILRSDEGTMLSTEEKARLTKLLDGNPDIFALGGEPTPYAEHKIETAIPLNDINGGGDLDVKADSSISALLESCGSGSGKRFSRSLKGCGCGKGSVTIPMLKLWPENCGMLLSEVDNGAPLLRVPVLVAI
ncbi:hypothetical protein NQ315_008224 [Exocentrus adspersus]|uniref:Uncharacterized protein n=1 Tax=Exocentrus adspersus TaxID=1586481 RepID=A0AAV8VMA0_9CUCU|nr:hypothetical protein NQ315_008224 [Exocentrus adspersus]